MRRPASYAPGELIVDPKSSTYYPSERRDTMAVSKSSSFAFNPHASAFVPRCPVQADVQGSRARRGHGELATVPHEVRE